MGFELHSLLQTVEQLLAFPLLLKTRALSEHPGRAAGEGGWSILQHRDAPAVQVQIQLWLSHWVPMPPNRGENKTWVMLKREAPPPPWKVESTLAVPCAKGSRIAVGLLSGRKEEAFSFLMAMGISVNFAHPEKALSGGSTEWIGIGAL